jgi:hypothetical protein
MHRVARQDRIDSRVERDLATERAESVVTIDERDVLPATGHTEAQWSEPALGFGPQPRRSSFSFEGGILLALDHRPDLDRDSGPDWNVRRTGACAFELRPVNGNEMRLRFRSFRRRTTRTPNVMP